MGFFSKNKTKNKTQPRGGRGRLSASAPNIPSEELAQSEAYKHMGVSANTLLTNASNVRASDNASKASAHSKHSAKSRHTASRFKGDSSSVSSKESTKKYPSKKMQNNTGDEPFNTDDPKYDTFEDWLQMDSRASFQLRKFKETNNTKLSLEGQLKSPAEANHIPHLIKNDSHLIWLNIGDSKIGPERCLAIIDALKSNTTLKFIGLSYSSIDLDGCIAIQGMMEVNRTLTSIDLKNNDVKNLGFVALMDALKNNTTITDIDLRRNNITGDSCHAMKDALLTNTTLQNLDLRGNSIGNEGCRTIMEGLHSNTTLFKLTLDRNNIRSNVLKECNVFVERNEVIHRHRENVKSLGISYYVTEACKLNNDNKSHLVWAETASGTIINEAAQTVESYALVVFLEQLRIIRNSKSTQLPDQSNPSGTDVVNKNSDIFELMRNKRALRRLLNQRINSSTYLTHTLAASNHPGTLDMLKYLVDSCAASFYTVSDDDGLTARAISLASEVQSKHEYANTHGTFLGRYIIDGGKGLNSNPTHKSSTSTVHFAHDVSKMENDPKYHVAIKIMTDEKSFLKVQKVRLSEGESLPSFSSGEDIPLSSSRYDANAIVALYRFHDEIDIKGEHYRCLIFEKEGKNLHQIIDSERIAGNDAAKIPFYGIKIAEGIQHVHSKGYIHGDIKPRNIIRSSNGMMKLIDLDDSVTLGEKLTEDCSSAFISPEFARALYGTSKKEGGKSGKPIQEQITDHHKTMKELDLSKDDDIEEYQVINEKIQSLLSEGACYNSTEEHLQASLSVDIWGFGVIMYYLCIGRPLFLYDLSSNLATESEKNRLLTWKGLSCTDLDVPTSYSERFGEHVITFLMKCLHGDPAERFQSMEEILNHKMFTDTDEM